MAAVPEYLSFNTAISFVTNTNWQNYGGESTLGYLTQMLGLTHQNFRLGGNRHRARRRAYPRLRPRLGQDRRQFLGRSHPLHPLHPPSNLHSISLCSSSGRACRRTLAPMSTRRRSKAPSRPSPVGPVASQIAIKMLGTNGGGFFNANAAHPFENPTPRCRISCKIISIFAIGAALTNVFGRMVGDRAPGLGASSRRWASCSSPCVRHDHLLGRGCRQPAIRTRSASTPPIWRARRFASVSPLSSAVRGHHHGRLLRRRQRHARQLHAARRHDPAYQHGTWRDHYRRRRRRPLRHADLRRHHGVRGGADGRPHAGICR